MADSKGPSAAGIVIDAAGVTVGGVSIQSLEDRIRSLEALLGNSPGTVGTDRSNNDAQPLSGSKTVNLGVDPAKASAEDGASQRKVEDRGHEEDRMSDGPGRSRESTEEPMDERGRSMQKPLYTRMDRRHISIETLERFQIPFQIDDDPNFVLIKRWIPELEQDELWDHTERIRRNRHSRRRDDSPQSRADRVHVTSSLECKIDRVPFEEWRKDTYKGNAVLEVATELVKDPATGEQTTIPVRLGIHSTHIWRGLRKTSSTVVREMASVMLPPWKILVTYEKEIRKYLDEAEQYARDKINDDKGQEEGKENSESTTKHSRPEEDEGAGTDVPKPEEKKARFAEEKIEIEDKPLPDGTPDSKRVKVPELCNFCKSEHEKDFDCVTETISHWRCLIEFMDTDLKPIFDLRRDIAAGTATEISFADLWHLFNPGDLILTSEPRRAYRVFHISGGRPCLTNATNYEKKPRIKPLAVECTFMAVESRGFSPVHETLHFAEFAGKLPIKSLQPYFIIRTAAMPVVSAYPIQFEENRESITLALVERGKRILELLPFSHKYYRGISAIEGDALEGDIILDLKTKEFERASPLHPMGIFGNVEYDIREITDGCPHQPPSNAQRVPDHMPGCRCWNTIDDFLVDTARAQAYKGDADLLSVRSLIQHNLTEDQLMLFSPDIRAYVLQQRRWWSIYVDQIQDLDVFTAQHQFENLVLPNGHERLLKAVIKPYLTSGFTARADDTTSYNALMKIPREKGLRILLHGPPGTGKLSTALAIAASTNRPVYRIHSASNPTGNVEVDADGIEQHLRRAQQWNCVLLFPDADILFSRRDPRDIDIEGNATLTALINFLDLYPGLVIFITRKVKAFDEGLVSRLNLALHFPKPDKEQTLKIWRQMLQARDETGELVQAKEMEEAVMQFVETRWNGGSRWDARQIQNFFQTAKAMVSGNEDAASYLITVIEASDKFADFHKASAQEQDEEDMVRLGFGGLTWRTAADSWEVLSRRSTNQVGEEMGDD